MLKASAIFNELTTKSFSRTNYLKNNIAEWQYVLSLSTYASSEYLISTIHYNNAYLENSEDYSLIIYENNTPVAIWPLTFSAVENKVSLQSNCKFIIPPLFISTASKKVIKKVYQQCLSLLKAFSLHYKQEVKLSYNPQTDLLWQRTLTSYINEIDYQQYLMVNISGSINEIKSTFRKSFKSLINKGERLWKSQLHTQMSDSLLAQFRQFHIDTSGKETRSIETWRIQQTMVNNHEAFYLTLVDDNQCLVGAALFNISPLQASYSVGVYDRSLFDLPLGHVVQLRAIEYMKTLGIKQYLLGNRHHLFEKTPVTEKENSIGFFKEGFSNEIQIEANAVLTFN
mgnify:CR=1 FL=1